jgi:hypothetical protein
MLAGCVPTGPQYRAGFAPAGKTLFFRCGGWNPRWGASHQGTLVRVKTPAMAPLWSLLPTALGRSRQDRARNIVSSHPPPILVGVGVGSTRAHFRHNQGIWGHFEGKGTQVRIVHKPRGTGLSEACPGWGSNPHEGNSHRNSGPTRRKLKPSEIPPTLSQERVISILS